MDRYEMLEKAKQCCVAVGVGIIEGENIGITLLGSGFLINSKGAIMTAGHVLRDCEKLKQINIREGRQSEIIVYRPEPSVFGIAYWPVGKKGYPKFDQPLPDGYLGPANLDVGIALPKEKYDHFPYLIPANELRPFEEIVICGYPSPNDMVTVNNKGAGTRLSAIMQFGHIAALEPYDGICDPTGIQTDIIGIGGSSGSPIISAATGELVGMALTVLTSYVIKLNDQGQIEKKLIGATHMGLVSGIPASVLREFMRGLPEEQDATRSLKVGIKLPVRGKFRTIPTKSLHSAEQDRQ